MEKTYAQKYYAANKERILAEGAKWKLENKEKLKEQSKEYYKENKERLLKGVKAYHESLKLPFVIVYCLPNNDTPYAGVTRNPKKRMYRHKQGCVIRDTSEWFILDICETREEALKLEAEYHSKGYAGYNQGQ